MKKLLAWTLSGMMLLSLTACGGEEKEPDAAPTPAVEASTAPAESAAPAAEESEKPAESAAPAESAEPEKLTQEELDPNRKVLESLTAVLNDPARHEEHAQALAELNELWYGEEAYEPAFAALLTYLHAVPRTDVVPDSAALAVFTENPYMIDGPAWMNLEDIITTATEIALDPNAGLTAREEALRVVTAQSSKAQADVFAGMIQGLDAAADSNAKALQEALPKAQEEFAH